jgi:hypothetical protein
MVPLRQTRGGYDYRLYHSTHRGRHKSCRLIDIHPAIDSLKPFPLRPDYSGNTWHIDGNTSQSHSLVLDLSDIGVEMETSPPTVTIQQALRTHIPDTWEIIGSRGVV